MRLIQYIKEIIDERNQIAFNILNESQIPLDYRRRIKYDKIDGLIQNMKSRFFDINKEPNEVDNAIDRLIKFVANEIIPMEPEIDYGTYKDILNILQDFIYKKYKDELTTYYEKRKRDWEEESNDNYTYVFYKHTKPIGDLQNRGFSEHISSFSELLTKYGSWVEVDWDDVKNRLDKINEFPKDSGVFQISYPIRISNIGDKGNNWGYNFSIAKVKPEV